MKIIITGASGFVGSALLDECAQRGIEALGLVRNLNDSLVNCRRVDFTSVDELTNVMSEARAIIHLAGRAHVLNEQESDPKSAYWAANVDLAERLLQAGVRAGVKQFVFVSSVKVNGEEAKEAYSRSSPTQPVDWYGQSKLEAESRLTELSRAHGIRLSIVRPPLIYGPGVKANFARLAGLVRKRVPLPFASINNKRSLVAVQNLNDLLLHLIGHPGANAIFYVSDDHDLSTAELIKAMATAIELEPRLHRMPVSLLRCLFLILGKSSMYKRLAGSLRVDISQTKSELDWRPPLVTAEGLKRALHK